MDSGESNQVGSRASAANLTQIPADALLPTKRSNHDHIPQLQPKISQIRYIFMDIEQLKQQLYSKIQATAKPDQPLPDVDLLKLSQLPTYQAHQDLKQQWQRSPMQGAIPSTPSDEDHIEIVSDALLDALDRLTFTHHLLESTGVSKSHTALFTAVADALNSTNEAIERCSDAPDEDHVTDADLEALNPFGE